MNLIPLPAPASDPTSPSGKQGAFPQTRWSMVVRAADADEAVAAQALGELLQSYWQPLYVYARRSGLSPEDAEDGVQGFCESLIRRGSLRTADPGVGRLRSFLLGGLQLHLREGLRHEQRQKRGGSVVVISWEEAEAMLNSEPVDHETPDKAFDRRWACTLMERVRGKLRAEYQERGRGEMYTLLEPALDWNSSDVSYEALGARLAMSSGAVTQAVKRMRLRYRLLLEQEISDTVDSPEALTEERNHLIQALSAA